MIFDEVVAVPSYSASLTLMRKRYSVHLGPEWSAGNANRLLQTFESIPQRTNSSYEENPEVAASVWRLTSRHIQDDISVEYRGEQRIVTIAEAAFVHATPLLEEHPPLVRIADIESLEAAMYLSIYGARMYIEFLVPHYKRDSYILKVTCRNSVDKKHALTINLFLQSEEITQAEPDIPFDGFYHIHTRELEDGAIRDFMNNALHNFILGTWKTDEVDFDDLEKILRKNLTSKEQLLLLGILDREKTKRVNVLRFLEILSMLFEEGSDIFRNQERKLTRLAILTGELRKLTEQLFT